MCTHFTTLPSTYPSSQSVYLSVSVCMCVCVFPFRWLIFFDWTRLVVYGVCATGDVLGLRCDSCIWPKVNYEKMIKRIGVALGVRWGGESGNQIEVLRWLNPHTLLVMTVIFYIMAFDLNSSSSSSAREYRCMVQYPWYRLTLFFLLLFCKCPFCATVISLNYGFSICDFTLWLNWTIRI